MSLQGACVSLIIAGAVLSSCRSPQRGPQQTPPEPTEQEPGLESVLIEDVPHVEQKPDFCGEACAEMWLAHLGSSIGQDEVFVRSGVDPQLGRGAWTRELRLALVDIGFSPGDVWYAVDGAEDVRSQFQALHADLARGVPSIVCMYWTGTDVEHFRLVLGYDADADEVIYHEPAEQDGAYLRMPLSEFLENWPLSGSAGDVVIRLHLRHEKIVELDPPPDLGPAATAQEIIAEGQG